MSEPAGAGNRIVAGSFEGTWRDLAALEAPEASAFFVGSNIDALRAVWIHATHPGRETLVAAHSRKEAGLVEGLRVAGLATVDVDGDSVAVDPLPDPRPATPGRSTGPQSGTERPRRTGPGMPGQGYTTGRGEGR